MRWMLRRDFNWFDALVIASLPAIAREFGLALSIGYIFVAALLSAAAEHSWGEK
jgi:hypothetical protein